MKKIYILLLFVFVLAEGVIAQCNLTCNDEITISLHYDCTATIELDDLLEDPTPGCSYTIHIFDKDGNPVSGNQVDDSFIGPSFKVEVRLPGGNKCESWVTVEDKAPPIIDCQPNITLSCHENGTGLPSAVDGCDPNVSIILMDDVYTDYPCTNKFTGKRDLTFQAVDKYGNKSGVCSQTIFYERADINKVKFPEDRDGSPLPMLDCNNPTWDLNKNGKPDPEEVGVPTLSGASLYPNYGLCDIWVDYEDLIWPLQCGRKVMRTWTVTDECTGNSRTHNQIIKIIATKAPQILCPPDQTVYSGGSECDADVTLPTATIPLGCGGTSNYTVSISGVTIVKVGDTYVAKDLTPGVYTVTYVATSTCGSEPSTCQMKLTVQDGGGNGPIPICDAITKVSLGINGVARVYASTFNDGSYDECGYVSIKVRRLNPGSCPPGVIDDTEFRDFVEFCCADIGQSPVKVIMQVKNNKGQTNQCLVLVNVEDALPPKITCPPNITVDCSDYVDIYDLSTFGTVVTKESDRKEIRIYDGTPGGVVVGRDGIATDNCDINITVEEKEFRNMKCNSGTIKRTFTATDSYGRKASCTQVIYVRGAGSNGKSITWPKDVTIMECMSENTHPDDLGYPTWNNSTCSMLAWSYKDEVYVAAGGGCIKILRKWKVLDWCTFDPDTEEGLYTHTQLIVIMDAIKPVMSDSCKDKEFCVTSGNNCEAYIDYYPTFSDCTPEEHLEYIVKIDLFSDGTVDIEKHNSNLSGTYPFGTHTIRWKVGDGCGNVFTCKNTITISDCKAPTAVCFHGLSTLLMPESGTLGLHVKLFNHNSFDNCTPKSELRLSYSPDVNDTIKFYNCDLLGIDTIQLWVTDLEGNQSYCITYVDIQDNLDACPDSLITLTSGLVATMSGAPMEGVHVIIDHPQLNQQLLKTDENGNYLLGTRRNINASNVTVFPYYNEKSLEGVTSYDLYLMHKAMLGEKPFTSPENIIASDIDNNGAMNGQDLLHLREILLGMYDNFPENTSWVFADKEVGLDEVNPYIYSNKKTINIPSAKKSEFLGIKVGDVNNTIANGLQSEFRNNAPTTLVYEDVQMVEGKSYSIELKAQSKMNLQSYQIYFEGLLSGIEIVSIESALETDAQWGSLSESVFSSVAYYNDAKVISKGELVMTIHMIATSSGSLSEHLLTAPSLPSLMADEFGIESKVELRSSDADEKIDEILQSVSSFPNPVNNEWNLRINTQLDLETDLSLMNVNGKEVLNQNVNIKAGINNYKINRMELLPAGVYFYTIQVGDIVFRGSIVKI